MGPLIITEMRTPTSSCRKMKEWQLNLDCLSSLQQTLKQMPVLKRSPEKIQADSAFLQENAWTLTSVGLILCLGPSDMSIHVLKPKVSLNVLVLTSYQKLGQVDISLRVLSFQNAGQKLDIKFRLLEFISAIYNFNGYQFMQKLASVKSPTSRLSKCIYRLS